MKIYFNGLELIALGVVAICGLILLIAWRLDCWCNKHYGSKTQKWLYKHLLGRDHR